MTWNYLDKKSKKEHVTNTYIAVSVYTISRVDPANKVRGRVISVIFGGQVSLQVHYCKRDKVHVCHNTVLTKQWAANSLILRKL